VSRTGTTRQYPGAVAIEFSEYDPAWPELAEKAIAEILTAMPGLFSAIEHMGSTSVPGLAAKPIIDLMAATGDLGNVVARDGELRSLGYEFRDAGMPGRLFYQRGRDGTWSHHLKTGLIQELTDSARAERGLPPVPVWEV